MLLVSPTALSARVDVSRIEKALTYYSNGKFFVDVFAYGSCVFPNIGEEHVEESRRMLAELPNDINFEVREMDDHNFIVKFTEHVFSVVFLDEYENMKAEVLRDIERSNVTETILGRKGTPIEHLSIGVVARTRLLEDISGKNYVISVQPRGT